MSTPGTRVNGITVQKIAVFLEFGFRAVILPCQCWTTNKAELPWRLNLNWCSGSNQCCTVSESVYLAHNSYTGAIPLYGHPLKKQFCFSRHKAHMFNPDLLCDVLRCKWLCQWSKLDRLGLAELDLFLYYFFSLRIRILRPNLLRK